MPSRKLYKITVKGSSFSWHVSAQSGKQAKEVSATQYGVDIKLLTATEIKDNVSDVQNTKNRKALP